MNRRIVGFAVAALLVVAGVGIAVLYRNPLYLVVIGGPGLVLLAAVALMALPSRGPQS